MVKKVRKSMALLAATVLLFVAGPTPVLLHALDHLLDSHPTYNHQYGSESDDAHHNGDHNHQQIFSLTEGPSVLPTEFLRFDRPVVQSSDIIFFADAKINVSVNNARLVRQSSDPPLNPRNPFSSSLTNKAPPAK